MDFLEKYGIKFNDIKLLETALTHSSYAYENSTENYERLEFLGDAVLQLITSEYFYSNTNLTEGEMSKIRASYVCEQALAEYSKKIGIDKHIKVGHGQAKNINDTIIADCFESVLGAIYLDQGFDVAKTYVTKIVMPYIESKHTFFGDYKSLLQELVQTDKKSLEYNLINESGPAHDKRFMVEVKIDNIVYGVGVGKSKKEAEQNAAYDAYQLQNGIKPDYCNTGGLQVYNPEIADYENWHLETEYDCFDDVDDYIESTGNADEIDKFTNELFKQIDWELINRMNG